MTSPDLSVLDLVPVRSDQHTADAVAASRSLAQVADELGYRRYWVAEHHNMPAVAATNPPVMIAILAAATSRIRIGSGGVMLPNHSPLVVAEQFALLEAAFPGRIDLGIGRAPGTDPLTRYVLRGGTAQGADEAVERFPDYVDDIRLLMSPDGVEMQIGPLLQEMSAVSLRHGVPLPASLTLAIKALAQVQLATAELDPALDPYDVAGKYVMRLMVKRMGAALNPKTLVYQSQKLKVRALRVVEAVENLIGARPGGPKLVVNFQASSLEDIVRHTGRRLALGLTAAASVLASGLTATSTVVAEWVPITFGVVGGLLTLGLVIDLLRGR